MGDASHAAISQEQTAARARQDADSMSLQANAHHAKTQNYVAAMGTAAVDSCATLTPMNAALIPHARAHS